LAGDGFDLDALDKLTSKRGLAVLTEVFGKRFLVADAIRILKNPTLDELREYGPRYAGALRKATGPVRSR